MAVGYWMIVCFGNTTGSTLFKGRGKRGIKPHNNADNDIHC